MSYREYICARCEKGFQDDTPTKEILEEYKKSFPEILNLKNVEITTICDDCYQKFMNWFNKLSKKEKSQMVNRNE